MQVASALYFLLYEWVFIGMLDICSIGLIQLSRNAINMTWFHLLVPYTGSWGIVTCTLNQRKLTFCMVGISLNITLNLDHFAVSDVV